MSIKLQCTYLHVPMGWASRRLEKKGESTFPLVELPKEKRKKEEKEKRCGWVVVEWVGGE